MRSLRRLLSRRAATRSCQGSRLLRSLRCISSPSVVESNLARRHCEVSHRSWEGRVIALAAEASAGLRRLALPVQIGDRAKTQIARAARAAGLSYWRAYD